MLVAKRSVVSNQINTMELDVTKEELSRHANGEYVQKVFPDLSVEEREFLITGMSLEEQEQFYKEE